MAKLGIIFGGNSTEHDASIHSYINVLESFAVANKANLIKKVIYIKGNQIFIYTERFPNKEEALIARGKKPLKRIIEELNDDIYWFSLLHGNEGEDGAYQGLAEIFGIKGSFGDLLPAGISMNKWMMAELAQSITKGNINLIPYTKLNSKSTEKKVTDFISEFPCDHYVVKPNRLGASLFTKKLSNGEVLPFFNSVEFQNVLKYDKDILLQKYMAGREFTLGIFQNGDKLIDLPIVEIFTEDNFLGHIEKHKNGFVRVTFDKVEKEIKDTMVENSKMLFHELNFYNFCRFDYILSGDKIYLLEANSIPGLMSCSIFTRMLKEGGFTIPQMIEIFSKNKGFKPIKDFRYEIE